MTRQQELTLIAVANGFALYALVRLAVRVVAYVISIDTGGLIQ